MMNRLTGIALATLGLSLSNQAAYAQQSGKTPYSFFSGTCVEAKGTLTETTNEGTYFSGTVSNAGWLNGTTYGVWTGTFMTLTPSVVTTPLLGTFAHTFMVTTNQGILKATTRIFFYDDGSNHFVSVVYIDPAASTGAFAGATGVLFL